MGRNFGERKKKRRGQLKKLKTKEEKTSPYKSNQGNVPQEPVTCREMVLYVPKAQQQQKSKSSGVVQIQRNSVPFGNSSYQEPNNDDDEWEDIVNEEDYLNFLEQIAVEHNNLLRLFFFLYGRH